MITNAGMPPRKRWQRPMLEILAAWIQSFRSDISYWEHGFGGYELKPQWGETAEEIATRKSNWNKALEIGRGFGRPGRKGWPGSYPGAEGLRSARSSRNRGEGR